MMKNTPESHSPHASELFSAAFDHETDIPAGISIDEQTRLSSEWSMIRDSLQSLPRPDIDLVAVVRTEIGRTAMSPVAKRKRPVLRPWIAVAASVAALLVLTLLPQFGGTESSQDRAIRSQALRSVRRQANPGTWNVVVLTVDHGTNVDDAMSGVFEEAGQQKATVMRLNRAGDANAEFSAGVFLASGAAPQTALESLIQDESAEWNPTQIGTHSSEDVKQRFLSSLQVPSRSDDVFGMMFVVGENPASVRQSPADSTNMPPAEVAVAEVEGVAGIAVADGNSRLFQGTQRSSEDGSQPSGSASTITAVPSRISAATPVLVIIRMRPPVSSEAVPGADEPHGQTNGTAIRGQLAV